MNKLKRMVSILFCVCLIFSVTSSSFAFDDTGCENEKLIPLMQFLDVALTHKASSDSFKITDQAGNDITYAHIEHIKILCKSNQIDELYNYIYSNNLLLSFCCREIEDKNTFIGDSSKAMYTEKFSHYFYGGSFDYETGSYYASWTILLYGWVTYNTITHAISNATGPTLDLICAEVTNSNTLTPFIDNISTNKQINSTNVNFSCSYSIRAHGAGLTYNFGTYYNNFYAVP